MTVTNHGTAPVDDWRLVFTLPSGQKIINSWNATVSPSSGAVTAASLGFNARIAAGGSQSFGFQGTYTGAFAQPGRLTLNGTACATA